MEIKTGGVDAASPMGYGLVINMISKSGGNQFRGCGRTQFQPFAWNADNTGQATPATRAVYQVQIFRVVDRSGGTGYGSLAPALHRQQDGAGRTPDVVAITAQSSERYVRGTARISWLQQPWAKVTAKAGANRTLSFVYQGDRLLLKVVADED